MIHIETAGQIGILTACHDGVGVVQMRPAWGIRDGDHPVAAIICHDQHQGQLVAERVVELLERHGLTDTPDTIHGIQ